MGTGSGKLKGSWLVGSCHKDSTREQQLALSTENWALRTVECNREQIEQAERK